MIRPITVSNYYTNYKANNNKPNFGHTQEMSDNKVDDIKKQGLNIGCLGGFMAGLAMAALAVGIVDNRDSAKLEAAEEAKVEALKKFSEIQKDKDIRKDTFTVKDVNKDNVPDIILYRNDGSQLVWDVKNNKVLDGINATKYFESEQQQEKND